MINSPKNRWVIGIIVVIVIALIGWFFVPKNNAENNQEGAGNQNIQIGEIENSNVHIENKTEIKNYNNSEFEKLRELHNLENGKSVNHLPNGVYGFSSPTAIIYEVRGMDGNLTLKKYYYSFYFEIQKTKDRNILIIGYISDESFAKIGNLDGENYLEIMLHNKTNEYAKNLVAIPPESINFVQNREFVVDNIEIQIFDLSANKIIIGVESHIPKET